MGFLGSRTTPQSPATKPLTELRYKILEYERRFAVEIQVPYRGHTVETDGQLLTTTAELAYFYEWAPEELIKKAKEHGACLKGPKWLILWKTEEDAKKFIEEVLDPQYTYLKLSGRMS